MAQNESLDHIRHTLAHLLAHAIQERPVQMAGHNPVSAKFGHRKPVKLGVDASRRHGAGADEFFQEVMNGLSSRFWDVKEYKVRCRRLHCARTPCLPNRSDLLDHHASAARAFSFTGSGV